MYVGIMEEDLLSSDDWYYLSLVPRPAPSFPSLAVRLSGRGPGTFPHISDVTDRENYANVGVM